MMRKSAGLSYNLPFVSVFSTTGSAASGVFALDFLSSLDSVCFSTTGLAGSGDLALEFLSQLVSLLLVSLFSSSGFFFLFSDFCLLSSCFLSVFLALTSLVEALSSFFSFLAFSSTLSELVLLI